ncbi:hypothetical protein [Alkalimonas amylolytica]|uniref:Lipocalin-like domain-containing protein n=1 Tax=Alkalimonas amylolytica TaxID=152573 RepID=A0A1H3WYG7_ALKAM|nr:hypothetical protein [Alkalimonas amylolytica]SDZ92237.1 hypothetical protein SAMN04488051_10123 [Alkalimonas amylolytica]
MKHLIVYFILLYSLIACANTEQTDHLYGQWSLEAVIFDDGSKNNPGAGNYVEVTPDYITEVISSIGRRQYPYHREGNLLTLTVGDEVVRWEIVAVGEEHLHIQTPIGRYILRR